MTIYIIVKIVQNSILNGKQKGTWQDYCGYENQYQQDSAAKRSAQQDVNLRSNCPEFKATYHRQSIDGGEWKWINPDSEAGASCQNLLYGFAQEQPNTSNSDRCNMNQVMYFQADANRQPTPYMVIFPSNAIYINFSQYDYGKSKYDSNRNMGVNTIGRMGDEDDIDLILRVMSEHLWQTRLPNGLNDCPYPANMFVELYTPKVPKNGDIDEIPEIKKHMELRFDVEQKQWNIVNSDTDQMWGGWVPNLDATAVARGVPMPMHLDKKGNVSFEQDGTSNNLFYSGTYGFLSPRRKNALIYYVGAPQGENPTIAHPLSGENWRVQDPKIRDIPFDLIPPFGDNQLNWTSMSLYYLAQDRFIPFVTINNPTKIESPMGSQAWHERNSQDIVIVVRYDPT